MPDVFAACSANARAWLDAACEAGFLDQAVRRRFEQLEHRRPQDLFVEPGGRPLVAAFFGGTGVGKSTLLNRLAGRSIARTGVERPTSVELTLYVHRDVRFADLPGELAAEPVRIERHESHSGRGVVWIDAPDIDSTRESNRRLMLSWMPLIDLVIYVVSPERYRDDAGWRVLLERRGRQGWLFVINRWDEGEPPQREDFAAMLRQAGFERPVLLCTTCRSPASPPRLPPTPDQFGEIERTLDELVRRNGVQQLERVGQNARFAEFRDVLRGAMDRLGDDGTWDRAIQQAALLWATTAGAIAQGTEYPLRLLAARLAARQTGLAEGWARLLAGVTAPAAGSVGSPAPSPSAEAGAAPAAVDDVAFFSQRLWDEWAQAKLTGGVDAVEVVVRQAGLPAGPTRSAIDEVVGEAGDVVRQTAQDHLRAALADPGSPVVNAIRRVTGFLTAALPGAALAVVTYQVIVGYWRAMSGQAGYLDGNFATHSVLLIALSWALPFAADRALRPSVERALCKAGRAAIESGLAETTRRLTAAMESVRLDARGARERAESMVQEIERAMRDAVHAGGDEFAGALLATGGRAEPVRG